MLEGAKSMGARAAVGIGNVFSSLIHSVAYRQMSLLLRRPPGREAFLWHKFHLVRTGVCLRTSFLAIEKRDRIPWIIYIIYVYISGDLVSWAACDGVGGVEGPPSPPVVGIQEAPVEAPEVAPAPPDIRLLNHPLLPDIQRRQELLDRYLINTVRYNPTLHTINETIRVQSRVERLIESALVHSGLNPVTIYDRRHVIRGIVFYPRGRALSLRRYRYFLNEISRLGTRDTRAYQRIIRALHNFELFL